MKHKSLPRLCFITHATNGRSHLEQVRMACDAGISWVQLRMKSTPGDEMLTIARQAKELCDTAGVMLSINDHLELAAAVGVKAVHLGREDRVPEEAKKILGTDSIIGATVNTAEDIFRLKRAPIDYIGLGPFRYTTTKKNLSMVLGPEGIRTLLNQIKKEMGEIPVLAIGGIFPEDVKSLTEVGCYGVAVASGIGEAEDYYKYLVVSSQW